MRGQGEDEFEDAGEDFGVRNIVRISPISRKKSNEVWKVQMNRRAARLSRLGRLLRGLEVAPGLLLSGTVLGIGDGLLVGIDLQVISQDGRKRTKRARL